MAPLSQLRTLLGLGLLSLSSVASAQNSKAQYTDWVDSATNVLNQWYDGSTGLWDGLWWNSGCILTTLGNIALFDQDSAGAMESYISNTFPAAQSYNGGSYLNDFYDDEGWWALGWIKAYDVTGNSDYLNMAVTIWQDLSGGLGATCGGHWWNKPGSNNGVQDNNAIGNALFLTVTAALGNRIPDQADSYLQYAQNEVDFFLDSGILDYDNWILYDQLDTTNDCAGIGGTWSYDEGAFMGGLIEFAQLSGNSTYLQIAANVAGGTIALLADPHSGILSEQNYPNAEQSDGSQFKGVFMRNLMYLQQVQPDDAWVSFIQNNANSIWNADQNSNGTFGSLWEGPMQEVSASSQGSALDCLVAAATLTTS